MDVFKYTVCVFMHVHNHPLVSTRDWFQDPSSYLTCQETSVFSEKALPLHIPTGLLLYESSQCSFGYDTRTM